MKQWNYYETVELLQWNYYETVELLRNILFE